MTRLIDDIYSRVSETIRLLTSHRDFTAELGEEIRKVGGVDRALKALKAEFSPIVPIESVPPAPITPKRWRDMGDYIILPVIVDRVSTGEEWIPRTAENGNRTNIYSNSVLRSDKFKTTPRGTYEVAVLKGSSFNLDPTIKQVRDKAKEKKFSDLNSDIACFIREQYTDEELAEMGLWWIAVIHKPIFSDSYLRLLAVDRDGGRLLNAYRGDPDSRSLRNGGFAFLASQVSLNT